MEGGKKLQKTLLDWGLIAAGNALLALLVAAFVKPHGIIAAGTTGISLALTRLFPVDVALVVLLLNLLMLLLGLIVLGKKFFLTTVASSLLYPIFLAMAQRIPGISGVTSQPLLAAIFAGGMLGLAIGMVMRAGSSTGGTDVVNLVMHKWFHWPVSVCVWMTDIVILAVQAPFSDAEQILYGILMLVIETLVLNQVMLLGTAQIQLMVVSSRFDELRGRLLTELEAGVTMLMIETGYVGLPQKGVLCVIPPRKLFAAKELIYQVDPNAFLTITQIREVRGQGFSFARRTGTQQYQQWEERLPEGRTRCSPCEEDHDGQAAV